MVGGQEGTELRQTQVARQGQHSRLARLTLIPVAAEGGRCRLAVAVGSAEWALDKDLGDIETGGMSPLQRDRLGRVGWLPDLWGPGWPLLISNPLFLPLCPRTPSRGRGRDLERKLDTTPPSLSCLQWLLGRRLKCIS